MAQHHVAGAFPATRGLHNETLILPRVYPILDTASVGRTGLTVTEAAEAMLDGGARILQFRHKEFWSRDTLAGAEAVEHLCRDAGARFVVNDRADYAAMLGADLHVGQEDLTPSDARRVIGPNAVLGLSTHNEAQLLAARNEPVDYLALGPIFDTASKDRPDPVVGLDGLRAMRARTKLPVVAIGGIGFEQAIGCWNAGADSVAIIGYLLGGNPAKQTLRSRMAELVRAATRDEGR